MSAEKPETSNRPIALGIAVAAGVIATILRIVPHPPNFSGVGAVGLYGGARMRAWQAYLLPLGIMIVSDLALWVLTGFNELYSIGHLSRAFVYVSFMFYVAIGRWLFDKTSLASIALAGTLGALQFFVVTNFCEWLFQPFMPMADVYRYSRDLNGLGLCYLAALGFHQNEPIGNAHPFMLFSDFRLSLVWMIAGDVLLTGAYLLVHAKLVQPRAEQAEVPAPEVQA